MCIINYKLTSLGPVELRNSLTLNRLAFFVTTGIGLGYSQERRELRIAEFLRFCLSAERLRTEIRWDVRVGLQNEELEGNTWTSGTINMDLFPRTSPSAARQQEQIPPPKFLREEQQEQPLLPREQAEGPPGEGMEDAGDL